MLYRITRRDIDDETISYEYLCGTRNLGKRCYSLIAYEKQDIVYIAKLCFSLKALFICLRHPVTDHYNLTSE